MCIRTGYICWINGRFPCGIMYDLSIFSLKLKHKLIPGERVIADDRYIGDPKMLYPDKHTRIKPSDLYKRLVNWVRATIIQWSLQKLGVAWGKCVIMVMKNMLINQGQSFIWLSWILKMGILCWRDQQNSALSIP